MFVRAYLRASTKEQDATRAKEQLKSFAERHGFKIAAWYVENESGASLKRPELFRLLNDSGEDDILLVEQIDRLSRLNEADWDALKAEINSRKIRIVSPDLQTSHVMMTKNMDEFTERMFGAVNGMLLDMLAAIARKDYVDRRRRQEQGIAKAKTEGKYRGRPEDTERNQGIMKMLKSGFSWNSIVDATGCSRSTLSRLAKKMNG